MYVHSMPTIENVNIVVMCKLMGTSLQTRTSKFKANQRELRKAWQIQGKIELIKEEKI